MNKENFIVDFKKSSLKKLMKTNVYLFDKKDEDFINNEVFVDLNKNGYKILDFNEYVMPRSEDYNIKLKDIGKFENETTIDDLIISDLKKKDIIFKLKLKSLENIVDDRTVLYIKYNDLFFYDKTFGDGSPNALYMGVSSILKDGIDGKNDKIKINALILLEKTEKVRDFCYYGRKVD